MVMPFLQGPFKCFLWGRLLPFNCSLRCFCVYRSGCNRLFSVAGVFFDFWRAGWCKCEWGNGSWGDRAFKCGRASGVSGCVEEKTKRGTKAINSFDRFVKGQ